MDILNNRNPFPCSFGGVAKLLYGTRWEVKHDVSSCERLVYGRGQGEKLEAGGG